MYVLDINLHNIPYFDKSDLAAGGNVLHVSLMYGPIRNHHIIQKSFGEDAQEIDIENQDVDVPDILPDMLTKSQIHKENYNVTLENNYVSDDDHVHKDVEVYTIVAHDGVFTRRKKMHQIKKGSCSRICEERC